MIKGLWYNGHHSTEYGLLMRSDDRTILPALRNNEIVVTGRHGTLDPGGNTYEKRLISITFFTPEKNLTALRTKVRQVASWLSQPGKLIFDDEPHLYYDAKVYSGISVGQIDSNGEFQILFECQPFAYSEVVPITFSGIVGPKEIRLLNDGTVSYRPLIEIEGIASLLVISSQLDSFSIQEINQKVYVDCKNMLCYTINGLGEKENKLQHFSGNFIEVPPGELSLSIEGVDMNISVIFNMQDVYV